MGREDHRSGDRELHSPAVRAAGGPLLGHSRTWRPIKVTMTPVCLDMRGLRDRQRPGPSSPGRGWNPPLTCNEVKSRHIDLQSDVRDMLFQHAVVEQDAVTQETCLHLQERRGEQTPRFRRLKRGVFCKIPHGGGA
ncbi:hypothetical protein NDU88_005112 [Pleurodeles waltl]|uniref:Uncharacterized protein n=1 Tax=Pleurodeles waltl TaxID=8319 RepID=A0AAV7PER6_PLEWA|nr:hypothetical protein NDU88_005112 [Pleurodeles waltl]